MRSKNRGSPTGCVSALDSANSPEHRHRSAPASSGGGGCGWRSARRRAAAEPGDERLVGRSSPWLPRRLGSTTGPTRTQELEGGTRKCWLAEGSELLGDGLFHESADVPDGWTSRPCRRPPAASPGAVCHLWRRGSLELDVKRVLVVALVVVVLFTGIPVLVGMSGAECADCDLGILLAGACVSAVLAATVGVALARGAVLLRLRPDLFAGLLATSGLYRPPRLV